MAAAAVDGDRLIIHAQDGALAVRATTRS